MKEKQTEGEMIKKLGDDLYQLTHLLKSTGHLRDEWIASGQGNTPQMVGKTPLEVLKKLYIKVNR